MSKEIDLAQLFPWSYQQLVVLGSTVASNQPRLPARGSGNGSTILYPTWSQSALAIPLLIGERVHHLIVVHSLKKEWVWPEPFITSLRLLGEIFVSALERRDILRSLEISQARLDVAAASAGVGLWEIDLVTGNIWTTNSASELFNFAQEEPITFSSLLEKIHPEDRSLVTETVERAQSLGLESQVEYRVPQPDGAMRWLISRGRVRQNGAGAAKMLAGVTVEITERKQMEQKLREQVGEINHLRELLEQENTLLRSEAGLNEDRHRSLGSSAAMQGIKVLIELVAKTGSTVLIQGETGTGKELVAQAIHQLSDRNKRLMITVNCAALPSALIESELFGREKGALPVRSADRRGDSSAGEGRLYRCAQPAGGAIRVGPRLHLASRRDRRNAS